MCHTDRTQSAQRPLKDKAQALRLQPAKRSQASRQGTLLASSEVHMQHRGLTFQGLSLRTGVCMIHCDSQLAPETLRRTVLGTVPGLQLLYKKVCCLAPFSLCYN